MRPVDRAIVLNSKSKRLLRLLFHSLGAVWSNGSLYISTLVKIWIFLDTSLIGDLSEKTGRVMRRWIEETNLRKISGMWASKLNQIIMALTI